MSATNDTPMDRAPSSVTAPNPPAPPERDRTEGEDVLREAYDAGVPLNGVGWDYLPLDDQQRLADFASRLSAALASRVPPSVAVARALMGDGALAAMMTTPEALRDHYIEYGRQEARAGATGEAVAWEVLNADGKRVSLCGTEDDAEQERREWEMNANSRKPHRVAPLYRAAPARTGEGDNV